MANKYVWHGRISAAKFLQILRLFCLDLSAGQTAGLTGLSRNTINKYGMALRGRMTEVCQREYEDQTNGKAPGCLPLPGSSGYNGSGKASPLIIGMTCYESGIYTGLLNRATEKQNIWIGLVDIHTPDPVLRLRRETRGAMAIKGFWGYLKSRLAGAERYNRGTFLRHLKEGEYRYNHSGTDVYTLLLESLKQEPLWLL